MYYPRFKINLDSTPVQQTNARTQPEFSIVEPLCKNCSSLISKFCVSSSSLSFIFNRPSNAYSSLIGALHSRENLTYCLSAEGLNILSKLLLTLRLANFGFKLRSPSSAAVLTKHLGQLSYTLISTQSAGTCSPSSIIIISPTATSASVVFSNFRLLSFYELIFLNSFYV